MRIPTAANRAPSTAGDDDDDSDEFTPHGQSREEELSEGRGRQPSSEPDEPDEPDDELLLQEPQAPAAQHTPDHQMEGWRCLIADDKAFNRKVLRKRLESTSEFQELAWQCEEVTTGEEVLAKLRAGEQYDIAAQKARGGGALIVADANRNGDRSAAVSS